MDGLFDKMNRTLGVSEQWRLMRQFEKRVLDEQAHVPNALCVVSHRFLSIDRAGMEDQPEPLPEPGSRYGLVGAVSSPV